MRVPLSFENVDSNLTKLSFRGFAQSLLSACSNPDARMTLHPFGKLALTGGSQETHYNKANSH
jgi:hypothetical protein